MMIIPQRSLDWIDRWGDRGVGKHDAQGNLLFEIEPEDRIARGLLDELAADPIMQHGVGVIIIEMVKRAAAEDGFE
jgi:hypothetical protein